MNKRKVKDFLMSFALALAFMIVILITVKACADSITVKACADSKINKNQTENISLK